MCQDYRICSVRTRPAREVYWIVVIRLYFRHANRPMPEKHITRAIPTTGHDLPCLAAPEIDPLLIPPSLSASSGEDEPSFSQAFDSTSRHAADAAPLRHARWKPPRGERGAATVARPQERHVDGP